MFRRPEGCDENGPAAALRRRSVLALLSEEAKRGRFAYIALPAAHFDRNETCTYFGDRTLISRVASFVDSVIQVSSK